MRLSFKTALKLIYKNLVQNLIILFTLIIGVTVQILSASLSHSLFNLMDEMQKYGREHYSVVPKVGVIGLFNIEREEIIKENNFIINFSKVFYMSNIANLNGQVVSLQIHFLDDLESIELFDLENNLFEGGRLPFNLDEIIVDENVAAKYKVKVNDKINYNFKNGDKKEYLVTGIFKTEKYDVKKDLLKAYAFSPSLPMAYQGRINKIAFEIDDPETNHEEFLQYLEEKFPPEQYTIYKWSLKHNVVEVFREAQVMVFTLIQVFIAAILFIILTSLINYTVTTHHHQIGILKALGYEQRKVQQIFFFKTLIMIVPALILGILSAKIGVCVLQRIMTYDNGVRRMDIIENNVLNIIAVCVVIVISLLATFNSIRKTKYIDIISIIKEN